MSAVDPFGLVGQVLDGQFRVDELVGEGGFSAVYLGHHQGLNEPIAIKCLKLPAALGTSLVDSFVQRFRDESRILYRLSQGNLHIVRSIAAGTTQAPVTGALVPYMVLEWLPGRSVQSDFMVRRASGERGRTLGEILALFDTAADGLGYAHAQGVVHRDLNPGNLFLATTQHGVKMKVLDFGVAKLMHDGALDLGPRVQTVGHIRIFAPAYGAPEQFDDRIGAVSAASDVYSFALILLEAMRDKSVVEGAHLGEFAQNTCDPQKRPTPRSLGLGVPDEVEQAFVRATALDPKQRWHSVAHFWQSLRASSRGVVEHEPAQAARETPVRAPVPSTPSIISTRERIPTTLGIPAPALGDGPRPSSSRLRAVASPGSTRAFASTMAAGSSFTAAPAVPADPGALEPPVATSRTSSRPPAVAFPRSPTPYPPTPLAVTAPTAPSDRPPGSGTDRPTASTSERPPRTRTDRPSRAPTTARLPCAAPVSLDAVRDSELPSAMEEEESGELDTRVHAPTPEVLRTLALNDAASARAAAGGRSANLNGTMAMPMPPAPALPSQPRLGVTLGMAQPYGQGSAVIPSTLTPQGAAPFGPGATPTYGHPSAPQPFAAPSFSQLQLQPQQPPHPTSSQPSSLTPQGAPGAQKPRSIVPLALVALALALTVGGVALGSVALRSRRQTPTHPTTSSSSAPSASVSLTPDPVVPETSPVPMAAVKVDAATTAVADAAATRPTSASAAPVSATTSTASPSVRPPPTATVVDPNAFSESTARTRLATANGVLSFCKKDGGVTGPGNASITFHNDGSVASVALDPPYAGTKEGDCASAQFRRAKVNPFTGPPQTVRHGFLLPK